MTFCWVMLVSLDKPSVYNDITSDSKSNLALNIVFLGKRLLKIDDYETEKLNINL